METIKLQAKKRDISEKLNHMRAERRLPAVVYGKTQESVAIELDYSEFLKAFRKAGESQIIEIDVEGQTMEVLVHDIQKVPVTGDFLHIDFYAITRGEKVHTNIALKFVGNAEAVKEGAIINEVMKEIEVKTLPRYLVESIEVDLSSLKQIGDHIRISDLAINPEHYELFNDPEDIVVNAAAPAKVEVEEPVVAEGEETEAAEEAPAE